jgi:hypothetical protein
MKNRPGKRGPAHFSNPVFIEFWGLAAKVFMNKPGK